MQHVTKRSGAAHRRSAFLLIAALVLSACGSTAYRDRVEVAAPEQGTPTDLPTIAGAGGESTEGPSEDAVAPSEGGTDGALASGGITTGPGTSGGSAQGPSGPTDPGQPGPGQPSTAPGPGEPQRPPTPGLPVSQVNGRGASDTEVRVGVVALTSFQNLGSNLGFTIAEKGDVKKQVQDMANWINENGGIAGRDLIPRVRIYTQEEASPGAEAQLCNAFADDDQVFAAVLYGQIHESTRDCYAGKKILMLDPTPFTFDETLYAELSPYMWNPAYPNYSKVMRSLPGALAQTDFFDPLARRGETATGVGVIHWDTPGARRVLQRDLTPALEAVGQSVASSYGVDGSSVATIQNGLSNAITQFRDDGANRIFFIGGSPLAPFFYSTAEGDGFRPRYAVTSLDQPRHTASDRGTPPQMIDAVGIGFNFDVDVQDEDVPMPATPNEKRCLDVLEANGHTFERRENANYALSICAAFLLLKLGSETMTGGLTAEVWSEHAEAVGTAFHPTMWFDSEFGPGNHDGTETYRSMQHFPDCSCFHYTSDARRFS